MKHEEDAVITERDGMCHSRLTDTLTLIYTKAYYILIYKSWQLEM